jgi:anti-sigma factor RsiW
MTCHEAGPLLNARLDNELDMAGSTNIDLHLSECRACAAQYAALQNLRDEIAAAGIAYAPEATLERNLEAQFLRKRKPPVQLWNGSWLSASLTAVAVGVALLIVLVPTLRKSNESGAMSVEILDNHLRALQPAHLVDVPSSDRHTVKPWFQGKVNFAPPVPDLSKDDFALLGGRLEVIHQQPAAAIVYRRRQHIVSLYVSPSPGADSKAEVNELAGYHLLHWRQNNLSYWAVSDVDGNDLRTFADLIRER